MTSKFWPLALVKVRSRGWLLTVAGLMVVLGLAFYTVRTSADEDLRRTNDQLTAAVGLVSSGQQQTLDSTQQLLSAVANVSVLKNDSLHSQCNAFLSSIQGDAKRYASLELVNLAGQSLCQAKLDLGSPVNVPIELVSKVTDTRSFEWGTYWSGGQGEASSIGAAAPVYGTAGELTGAVVAALQLDQFGAARALGPTLYNETAVNVIDRGGVIVDTASLQDSRIGARLPAAVFSRLLPRQGPQTFEAPDARGVATRYASQAVLASGTPVLYVVASPRSEARESSPLTAAANPFSRPVWMVTLLAAGLLVAMVWRWRRRAVDPVGSQLLTRQSMRPGATDHADATDRPHDNGAVLDAATTNVHVGAWQVRIPALEVTWSRELCVIHEVPPDYQPTLDAAISFYVPEHRSVIRHLLDRCALTGEGFEVDLKLLSRLQKTLLVRVIGNAVRDVTGTIIQVEGELQDISVIRRVETSQSLTANRLSTMLETMSDALITLDGNWQFTFVNAQAERLLRTSRRQLLGKSLGDEFPAGISSPFKLDYLEALKSRKQGYFESFYAPLRLWLDISVYESGDGLAVCFRDVTKSRAESAELELLKTAIARINDMVLIIEAEPVDAPGPRIVFVNDAFERLTGYSRAEVMGKSPSLLQGPGTSRAELDRIQVALKAWQPVRAELLNYAKTGKEFWIELDIVPIANAEGSYTHWVTIERDITERRATVDEILKLNNELEDKVTQRTAQLTAVNKELEAFSYSVSHDLRAPLIAIIGFATLLGKREASVLSNKAQHYLKRIQSGAARMNELIDGLLVLAKSASEPITRKRVDLSELAHRMALECQERQPERHVEFSIQEGIYANADPLLMSVVLHNLISNACKFSVKTPAARIGFGQKTDAAGQSVYFVKDNGAGFDEAYADKLFGVFQRLHTAEDFGGTGIGLANVKRVINRHGGSVWAHGKVGEGAVFYFTLG